MRAFRGSRPSAVSFAAERSTLHFLLALRKRLSDPRLILPLIICFVLFNTAGGVFRNELWNDEFRTWRDGIEKPLWAVLTWQHNPDHAPLGHLLARAGAAISTVSVTSTG